MKNKEVWMYDHKETENQYEREIMFLWYQHMHLVTGQLTHSCKLIASIKHIVCAFQKYQQIQFPNLQELS